ncbi:hypothetical protein EUTSA_v10001118mg, partial [Eutrema salsugineum]
FNVYLLTFWQRHNNKMARLFSSMPMYPYVLIDRILNGQVSSDGHIETRMVSNTEKKILIMNEEIAKEIRDAMNTGYCCKKDRLRVSKFSHSIHITRDDYDLSDLKVSRPLPWLPLGSRTIKVDTLPSLPLGSQIINAVTMSSCEREDINNHKDFVAVLKLSGSQLKVYRSASPVGPHLRWNDIENVHEYMSPFSSLMFSKKDQKFYIPSPGGAYLCSFDLNFKEKDTPELVSLWINLLPPIVLHSLADLIPMTRTDHMVESPSGEQFFINWYYGDDLTDYNVEKFGHKTKRFMVFKVEESSTDKNRKNMTYTENIGDLCIFLGRDEAFSLEASSSPGLKPNCIYFVGYNYGVFDLNTQICTLFSTEEGPLRSTGFPYWPPPLYITPI